MKVPQHIAIIMDGNGRWASKHGLPRIQGHERGADRVRIVVDACCDLGISYLTLYAFSSENWGRPKPEVDALMALLVEFLRAEIPRMHQKKIRLNVIGAIDQLPQETRCVLQDCLQQTKDYTQLVLTLALSYGSRDEIIRSMHRYLQQFDSFDAATAQLTDESFSACLDTNELPDPDLMIRTSGEQRLSNFLLWQAAYAELVFTDVMWPDFDRSEFEKALCEFAQRERRYGLTEEERY